MSISMDKLIGDLQTLRQRKEETLTNYHQILGAISILEQMIAEFIKNQKPDEGDEDVSANDEETKQAS